MSESMFRCVKSWVYIPSPRGRLSRGRRLVSDAHQSQNIEQPIDSVSTTSVVITKEPFSTPRPTLKIVSPCCVYLLDLRI